MEMQGSAETALGAAGYGSTGRQGRGVGESRAAFLLLLLPHQPVFGLRPPDTCLTGRSWEPPGATAGDFHYSIGATSRAKAVITRKHVKTAHLCETRSS